MLKHLLRNPKSLKPEEKAASLVSAGRLLAIVLIFVLALLALAAVVGASASSPFYYTVVQAQVILPRILIVVPLAVSASYLGFLIYQAFENTLLSSRVFGHEANFLNRSIVLAGIVASTVLAVVLAVMGK